LKDEQRQIIENIINLVYFMRGSISYNEMMLLSVDERIMVGRFINARLEQEKDHSNPVY